VVRQRPPSGAKAPQSSLAARLLVIGGMVPVLMTYGDSPLALTGGPVYVAQAAGREREDGMWEGWLEFVPGDGSAVLRSPRETTQPNRGALEYWAGGLTPVYLRGALERTLTARPAAAEPSAIPAAYDARDPVLNPFSVYAKSESILRRQLAALSPRHLRDIIVAYEIADPADLELDALTVADAIEMIVTAVRGRLAA
jgi:hypothetical protein